MGEVEEKDFGGTRRRTVEGGRFHFAEVKFWGLVEDGFAL